MKLFDYRINLFNLIIIQVFFICFLGNFASFAQNLDYSKSKRYVLLINKVIPGSPANESGVVENDIIYSLNKRVFYDIKSDDPSQEFINYLNSLPDGKYDLEVIRNNRKIPLKVKLSSLKVPKLGVMIESLENNPQTYFNMAISALKLVSSRKDLIMVANLFEKAKLLSPEWPAVYYNLGMIYEKLDYYDKAWQNYEKASEYRIKHAYLLDKVEFPSSYELLEAALRNQKKEIKLEEIKLKMANGRWSLIGRIPESKISSTLQPIPKFRFESHGKLMMENPLSRVFGSRRKAVQWLQRCYEKTPWIPVEFDGKYFEIKWIEINEGRLNEKNYFFPVLNYVRGEIYLDLNPTQIILRHFTKFLDNKHYDFDFERAYDLSINELKSYDYKVEDFKYEYRFKIE